jgi:SAM-dependent methyltransferase
VTLEDLRFAAGRKLARVATRAVVAQPVLWRIFRRPLRAQFDRLAPQWEEIAGRPEALAPLSAAFDRLKDAPSWVLDVGTGTGKAARHAAERFPEAHVVGVDLSPEMVDVARKHLPPTLVGRIRYEVSDAARLPFVDGAFDLVMLVNMIPFFDEIARVTAPAGTVVVVSYSGPSTPIWTPPETLRERLAELGFGDFEEIAAGAGTAFLARRPGPG